MIRILISVVLLATFAGNSFASAHILSRSVKFAAIKSEKAAVATFHAIKHEAPAVERAVLKAAKFLF